MSQARSATPSVQGSRTRRRRRTHASVFVTERVARFCITVGGIGTIVSVALIFIFLVSIVVPLFRPGALGDESVVSLDAGLGQVRGAAVAEQPARELAAFFVDEYLELGALLRTDSGLEVIDLKTGMRLDQRRLFAETPSALRAGPLGGSTVFGFADGGLRPVRFDFGVRFVERAELPEELRGIAPGARVPYEGGLLTSTAEGTLRHNRLLVELEEALPTSGVASIRLLARAGETSNLSAVALDESGVLRLFRSSLKRNLLSGDESLRRTEFALEWERPAGRRELPAWLELSGLADNLLLVWRDGFCQRMDLRDPSSPAIVEKLDLVEDDAQLTALQFMIGGTTLMTGDSAGRVRGWFRVKPEGAGTEDGAHLVLAKQLPVHAAAVSLMSASRRSRLLAVGYEDGSVRLFNVTSRELIASADLSEAQHLVALDLAPKEDAIVALTDSQLHVLPLDPKYPEANLTALFTRVWYEGSERPEHVWQSTGGSDDFEPKLGLVPLIFGSLKATFYTMLLGAPLALLAAIYTSEFLAPRWRGPLKSTIEMMASLPSVVLGFLAAIVVAPFVEPILPGVLAMLVTVPFALLLGAHVWQLGSRGLRPASSARERVLRGAWLLVGCLLPALGLVGGFAAGAPAVALATLGALLACGLAWRSTRGLSLPLPDGLRLVTIALLLLATMVATVRYVGPWCERRFFAGDLQLWLDGQHGQAWGGWFLLLLPLVSLLSFVVQGRSAGALLLRRSSDWSRARCARASLLKFLVVSGLTLVVALVLSRGLQGLGLDPRGGPGGSTWSPVGSYVQRNAMIVGFMMGFAVIPIIYTIAEDALSSVPNHLRLASLGAGATPWQTAMRVICPTAMSGLFSALMIGLGRAVGETMIVLMATGNTPIMQANIFNGFRTLSANIAVELPEAVRNSAHYRTLFLAALVLFAMTFVINTLAEFVRQHFRKRAFEL